MNRNLDGIYFRIKRKNKYEDVCFSDLTEDEMNEVLKDRDVKWLKSLAKMLGRTIREIGNQFDIICED